MFWGALIFGFPTNDGGLALHRSADRIESSVINPCRNLGLHRRSEHSSRLAGSNEPGLLGGQQKECSHRAEQEKAKEITAKRAEEVAAAVEDFDTDGKLEAFKKDIEAETTMNSFIRAAIRKGEI